AAASLAVCSEPHVLELDPHRRTRVNLDADEPSRVGASRGPIVDGHGHHVAVDDVDQHVAAGNEVEVVPVVDPDVRLERLRVADAADDDGTSIGRHPGALATQREKAAPAFLVQLSRVAIVEVDVGLVTPQHPAPHLGYLDAAVLDAAVGGVHPEPEAQLEVAWLPAPPDEERVA